MLRCANHVVPVTSELAEDILATMSREGVWAGLGDGQTLEDMICQNLAEHGADLCPECGRPLVVTEETLGRISMEMLAHC